MNHLLFTLLFRLFQEGTAWASNPCQPFSMDSIVEFEGCYFDYLTQLEESIRLEYSSRELHTEYALGVQAYLQPLGLQVSIRRPEISSPHWIASIKLTRHHSRRHHPETMPLRWLRALIRRSQSLRQTAGQNPQASRVHGYLGFIVSSELLAPNSPVAATYDRDTGITLGSVREFIQTTRPSSTLMHELQHYVRSTSTRPYACPTNTSIPTLYFDLNAQADFLRQNAPELDEHHPLQIAYRDGFYLDELDAFLFEASFLAQRLQSIWRLGHERKQQRIRNEISSLQDELATALTSYQILRASVIRIPELLLAEYPRPTIDIASTGQQILYNFCREPSATNGNHEIISNNNLTRNTTELAVCQIQIDKTQAESVAHELFPQMHVRIGSRQRLSEPVYTRVLRELLSRISKQILHQDARAHDLHKISRWSEEALRRLPNQ